MMAGTRLVSVFLDDLAIHPGPQVLGRESWGCHFRVHQSPAPKTLPEADPGCLWQVSKPTVFTPRRDRHPAKHRNPRKAN